MTLRRWMPAALVSLSSALVIAVAYVATAAPSPADGGPGWWFVPPRTTFYRTANDAKAETAAFFILAELPFSDVKKPLTIEVFGDYRSNAGTGDTRNVLHGVFTRTPTILASNVQRRLPDAIAASCTVATGPTYHQSLATEIPEDFRIVPNANGKFTIPIPAGAQWIVVCAPDSYYGDNDDPDGDFFVRFSRQ